MNFPDENDLPKKEILDESILEEENSDAFEDWEDEEDEDENDHSEDQFSIY